jgi:thiamine pyridinylase
MNIKRSIILFISIILMLSISTGCVSSESSSSFTTAPNTSLDTDTSLTVALYGYVPDVERFEKAVRCEWNKIEPNIDLNFVAWDCYETDPTDDLDVIVYDGLFLHYYLKEGYLLPIPDSAIEDKDDLLNFALEACTKDSTIYAIPQIICTNLLYYRNGDTEIANVNTVDELYSIIGDRKTSQLIPENNEGLLMDISGGTTKVCLYLDALIDHNQKYTDYDQLPAVNDWNEDIVNYLKMLQKMAGEESAAYWPEDNDAYVRAKWFQEGSGRAYVGFTEAMSSMGDSVNDIDFKLLSYCEHNNIPLFYGDIVSVNSSVVADKQESAFKLANLIAASDTMVNAISPDENNTYPQYLLPARKSVYARMGSEYPIYEELKEIAYNPQNKLFLLGDNATTWLEEAKDKLSEILAQ